MFGDLNLEGFNFWQLHRFCLNNLKRLHNVSEVTNIPLKVNAIHCRKPEVKKSIRFYKAIIKRFVHLAFRVPVSK